MSSERRPRAVAAAFSDLSLPGKIAHLRDAHHLDRAGAVSAAHDRAHELHCSHTHAEPRRLDKLGHMAVDDALDHMRKRHRFKILDWAAWNAMSNGKVRGVLIREHNAAHRNLGLDHYHDLADEEVLWQTDLRNPDFEPDEYWTRDGDI